MTQELSDVGSERALLGAVISGGKDTFMDVSEYIHNEEAFSYSINQVLWRCIKDLFENDGCTRVDADLIRTKAKSLDINVFDQKRNDEYLELLSVSNTSVDNVKLFCYQVRRFYTIRALHRTYNDAIKYLQSVDKTTPVSEIVSKCENDIVNALSGGEEITAVKHLSDGLDEYIDFVINHEPVDQVGLSTGFNKWDKAIGGGLRPGTVNVVAARPKVGKSYWALNVALNVAKTGVPVLYLDTELTHSYQQSRMVCIESGCPIGLYETGQFGKNTKALKEVRETSTLLKDIPIYHESIAGKDYSEAIAVARRWLVKHVGFNELGKANPCAVVYDYLKLASFSKLTKETPEYIQLGILLTSLHDFAVKYELPVLGMVQLNRSGIESEETDAIAGSDRILWLCSSMSYLKNKDHNDIETCGLKHGNKKLKPIETRYGPGLSNDVDYINLFASLKPGVGHEANGKIKEGTLLSEHYRDSHG